MLNRLPAAVLLLAVNAAPAAPAPAPEAMLETPLTVEYKLTAGGKAETTLIHGMLQAEPFKTAAFQQRVAKTFDELQLKLKPAPRRDGTVAVEVAWEEGTPEGRIISWEPSLHGKRGEPLRANVSWGGSQRAIELTVK